MTVLQSKQYATTVCTIKMEMSAIFLVVNIFLIILSYRTRALRKVCQSNPHKVQKYHPEAFIGGKWLW